LVTHLIIAHAGEAHVRAGLFNPLTTVTTTDLLTGNAFDEVPHRRLITYRADNAAFGNDIWVRAAQSRLTGGKAAKSNTYTPPKT